MATSVIKRDPMSYLSNTTYQVLTAKHFDMNTNRTCTITFEDGYPILFLFGQSHEPIAYVIIGQNVMNVGNGQIKRLDSGTGTNITLETGTARKLILKMPADYFNFDIITMNRFSVEISA